MKRKRLVIFDYSGTLSMEAALFSRPGRLVAELKECGLADLGIETPDIFWKKIVNPTWEEGSTTSIGYAAIMKKCIRKVLNPHVSGEAMNRAVSLFVARYFENSTIDPLWGPVLARVANDESVCGVVATDHYAEATGYIIGHLETLGIHALSVESTETDLPGHIYVVNSADLGARKTDPLFWEKVKQCRSVGAVTGVMIVDDFGFNETEGDAYTALARVNDRKARTEALLADIFSAPVDSVPFMIEFSGDVEAGLPEKINQVSDLVRNQCRS